MVKHAHLAVTGDAADFDGVETPLLEYAEDFVFAALLRHQQHAFLRFAEHDLVSSHAGFALGNAVEFDLGSDVAARSHLAGGAGQAGCTHVLNANDGARLHGLEASFKQQLFEKRIADLNIRPFRLGSFAEFFAGHGGAVNAVAAGFRSHINHRIAFAGSLGVEDLIAPHQSHGKRIHQRIAGIAGFEFGFAAEVGYAKAISVRGNATDHTLKQRVILVDLGLCGVRAPSPAAFDGRQSGRTAANPLPLRAALPW